METFVKPIKMTAYLCHCVTIQGQLAHNKEFPCSDDATWSDVDLCGDVA